MVFRWILAVGPWLFLVIANADGFWKVTDGAIIIAAVAFLLWGTILWFGTFRAMALDKEGKNSSWGYWFAYILATGCFFEVGALTDSWFWNFMNTPI